MLNITSLLHPTMIRKIRLGLRKAACNKGHEMGGHGKRVYIANRKGHNIMRIDWIGHGKEGGPFVAYGGADWGRTDITDIVKEAIQRGCSHNRVKPRQLSCDVPATPSDKAKAFVAGNPSVKARLMRLAALLSLIFIVMAPDQPAMADKPPTALELACTKEPNLLVCEWVIEGLAKFQKEQNKALQGKSTL